jgi:hypothetical protein
MQVDRLEDLHRLDELVTERVLEGALLDALEQLLAPAHVHHFFVLDVGTVHPADALRQVERLGVGERRHGVEAAVALPDDGRVGALLNRHPDGEAEADALEAGDLEVGAVADTDLVDLVEVVIGRVAAVPVGHARLDAEAHQPQLPDLDELVVERLLVLAQDLVRRVEGVGGMRDRQRCRGVHVVDSRLERRREREHVELDRQEAAEHVGVVLLAQGHDRVHVGGIHLLGREALFAAQPLRCRPRLGQIVVGHHHLLEDLTLGIAPPGDRRRGFAHAAAAHNQDLHAGPPLSVAGTALKRTCHRRVRARLRRMPKTYAAVESTAR